MKVYDLNFEDGTEMDEKYNSRYLSIKEYLKDDTIYREFTIKAYEDHTHFDLKFARDVGYDFLAFFENPRNRNINYQRSDTGYKVRNVLNLENILEIGTSGAYSILMLDKLSRNHDQGNLILTGLNNINKERVKYMPEMSELEYTEEYGRIIRS